jgi:hypothetical protein
MQSTSSFLCSGQGVDGRVIGAKLSFVASPGMTTDELAV